MDAAIVVKNVSVILQGQVRALQGVNLELPRGKTIGLIGPSGAGKTTLMRCLVGRLGMGQGSITIFGLPAGSPGVRQQIGYMTQELSVYSDLTIRENLRYFVTMTGQPRKQSATIISGVLKAVDLTKKADSLVSNLSSGQKQRVSLAIALIGSPPLLVLDEPTVGLDPVLREKLWQLFKQLASQGTTLIISSHAMDEAERCEDLVLIRDGKVVAHSSPKELCSRTGTKTVEQSFLKLAGAIA